MKLQITREWLARQLARGDDSNIGVGGTTLDSLRLDVGRRGVTPAALTEVPSELGKVVRFVREQRGWTVEDLAKIADVEVIEISTIETAESPELSPRTAVYLADALGFSRTRMQDLARHVSQRAGGEASQESLRFAARSRGTQAGSEEQYESIRALVAVLADREETD